MKGPQPTTATPVRKFTKSASLITRFALPLVSKRVCPIEQDIQLDEPFRKYAPGDTVKGAVNLTVSKAVRVLHLTVRLHGFVKVINSAKLPGETIGYDESLLVKGRGRGIEYFGNGFARLFEDEDVLCGDGRLDGSYKFRFELLLPYKGIPSSIDFEHGTISYLLSSTLTRHSNILLPTLTSHRKLNVIESIDIANVQKPTSHTVTLEAITKGPKARAAGRRKATALSDLKSGSSLGFESVNGEYATHAVLNDHLPDEPPQSPVPSEISTTSATSSNSSSNCPIPVLRTSGSISGIAEEASTISFPLEVITAKTELLQGGCLAGDILHLRISIDHTKAIKSMQGLIVTLYRLGRVDTHPAIPLGPLKRGGNRQFEDYYPKSRTGLGGLSLSSAGSSRVFRQDLAQVIAPLIVDPLSLTAIIKASVQVPDHVFPTITSVPGTMISFKYYVEVVIDLRGKLAAQDRILPRLNMMGAPQYAYGDPKISRVDGADGISFSATPGFNYLITDQMRRTKGVVFTATEVIVGTRDSTRSRGKQKENIQSFEATDEQKLDAPSHEEQTAQPASPQGHQFGEMQQQEDDLRRHPLTNSLGVAYNVPPPEIEEDTDEKGRMRRAEQRLLPSAPPQDDENSQRTTPSPTAPPALDQEDFVHRYGLQTPAPAYQGPYALSTPTLLLHGCSDQDGHGPDHVESPPIPAPQDDKQELERQRLQGLVSEPEGHDDAEPSTTRYDLQSLQSSAPILYEDDLCNGHGFHEQEDLEYRAAAAGDDKQEMERRHLEAQASSPDYDVGEPGTSTEQQQTEQSHPSAPAIPEEDNQRSYELNENLPAYRR